MLLPNSHPSLFGNTSGCHMKYFIRGIPSASQGPTPPLSTLSAFQGAPNPNPFPTLSFLPIISLKSSQHPVFALLSAPQFQGGCLCIIGMKADFQVHSSWQEHNHHFYDYINETGLDWPCTSCQWGPTVLNSEEYAIQKIYYSCRTGGHFSTPDNIWKGTPNYIAIATVEIPKADFYFIPELRAIFGNGDGRPYSNLKIRSIITHPGEVIVIKAFRLNRKIFASKNDTNEVFVWTNDKYKAIHNGTAHNPDITLLTSKSSESNFALTFTPTLPRVATASGNKIEVFDLESATTRRELVSVISSSVIAPSVSLQIATGSLKEKIEDIAFKDKNNEICVAGGHARRIGLWDLRLGKNLEFIEGMHDGDIHSISWKDNYILSGASDGTLVIVDDRMTKSPLYTHKRDAEILSVHWSPENKFFGVGSDNLYFYNFQEIESTKEFKSRFTHFGMRGPVNDFDWGTDNQWDILSTCHESESGGSLHAFRPIDLIYIDQELAAEKLERALQTLTPEEQGLYL